MNAKTPRRQGTKRRHLEALTKTRPRRVCLSERSEEPLVPSQIDEGSFGVPLDDKRAFLSATLKPRIGHGRKRMRGEGRTLSLIRVHRCSSSIRTVGWADNHQSWDRAAAPIDLLPSAVRRRSRRRGGCDGSAFCPKPSTGRGGPRSARPATSAPSATACPTAAGHSSSRSPATRPSRAAAVPPAPRRRARRNIAPSTAAIDPPSSRTADARANGVSRRGDVCVARNRWGVGLPRPGPPDRWAWERAGDAGVAPTAPCLTRGGRRGVLWRWRVPFPRRSPEC